MKHKIIAAALAACMLISMVPVVSAAEDSSLAYQLNPEESVSEYVMSTNQDTIWWYFKAKGFSDEGISGIMGNLEAESGYLPNNLENLSEQQSGWNDADFTAAVDDGTITRDMFISSPIFGVCSAGGTESGTEYGYGLAQWTYTSRKAGLYDFAKDRGVSIADLTMQLDYIYQEMGSSLRDYMTTADNVSDACLYFHNKYEGSADSKERLAGRIRLAEAVYEKYHSAAAPEPDTENPVISDVQITKVTSTGYTITCTVTDNEEIASVTFPTWTETDGEDDRVESAGTVDGTTATCTISINDHGGQTNCNYITQVTATDTSGNSVTVTGATVYVEPLTNGWIRSEGFWYYYIEGVPATGWQKVSGKWYYMNTEGVMLTGWQKVGGKWYFLRATGAMATGWMKSGGSWYYLKSTGEMATGWCKVGSVYYYFASGGAMQTGWLKYNGSWYYLKSSGAMATGWCKVNNTWYCFTSDGAMYSAKWKYSGGNWYYLKSSGAMAKSETLTIKGVEYTFDENGVMQ